MNAQVAGFILRAKERDDTATFYRALGLETHLHAHGGPVHFELGPTDTACVAEIYKKTANFHTDALMVKVTSLHDALTRINQTPDTKEVGDMHLAYVTDPDGRAVMVYEVIEADACPAPGLAGKKCLPCTGKVPRLSQEEIALLLDQLDGWKEMKWDGCLKKSFQFEHFKAAMSFLAALGHLAEEEQHHPDFTLEDYRHVHVTLITKSIDALSINDFIIAAKIDALMK